MRHALRFACLVMALATWIVGGTLSAVANPPRRPLAAEDPGALCNQAILAAEREHAVPAALLQAIAKVESGRADPRTGMVTPWPWTINAEGQGRWFATRQEAILAAQALQARGVRSFDVGCLQVNLHHHPLAFASLDEAFDPRANARYAGRFLTGLFQQRKSWDLAAAGYHSSTPDIGEAYRLKVMAAWPAMAVRLAAEQRREAMVAGWDAGRSGAARLPPGTAANGFQALAMDLARRPPAAATRLRGLLDAPEPPTRVTIRGANGRPIQLVELAETPFRR